MADQLNAQYVISVSTGLLIKVFIVYKNPKKFWKLIIVVCKQLQIVANHKLAKLQVKYYHSLHVVIYSF